MNEHDSVRGLVPRMALFACTFFTLPVQADSIEQALGDSSASLALRLRHESSMQDNALRDARANSLRHRISLSTGVWRGLRATVETEGTAALGDENYNSGPGGNGNTDFSVVADPTGNELNQAHLSWLGEAGSELRLGRQRIIYDNARFIGNVGWRQNEQTFDAAHLRTELGPVTLRTAYLSNVNRIFFDNVDLEGQLLNLQFSPLAGLRASLYGYWLDYRQAEDSRTLGLRLSGKPAVGTLSLSYAAEYAQQADHADSSGIDADYGLLELGLGRAGWRVTLGQERLGGDGARGFSTPLATLHKFNGFADMFLATPADGLRDSYLKVQYAQGKFKWLASYHQFGADRGGADYGREFDAVALYKYGKAQSVGLKYADYSAENHGVDTRKLVLDLSYSF